MAAVASIHTRYVSRSFAGCNSAVVTTIAGALHLRVVDSKRRRPSRRGMATLAESRCCHVCCALAGRINTIVTTRATRRDACVIEFCGLPSKRMMARAAVLRRDDMRRCFARRTRTIVTSRATASHFIMIDVSRWRPRIGRMTCNAAFGAKNVRSRLRRGGNSCADCMAANASFWRRLEHGVDMTRLAGLVAMGASQFKASR
jgi:hypothetical protein